MAPKPKTTAAAAAATAAAGAKSTPTVASATAVASASTGGSAMPPATPGPEPGAGETQADNDPALLFDCDAQLLKQMLQVDGTVLHVAERAKAITSRDVPLSEVLNVSAPLEYVNLSHNRITSLVGLETCTSLRILNVGHNAVLSLAPLRGLSNIHELWVNNNHITSLRQVEYLSSSNLRKLLIHGNPACKSVNHDDASSYFINLLTDLELVSVSGDAIQVTESARAVAKRFMHSPAAATLASELNEAAKQMVREHPELESVVKPLHTVGTPKSDTAPTSPASAAPEPTTSRSKSSSRGVRPKRPAQSTPASDSKAAAELSLADALASLPDLTQRAQRIMAKASAASPPPKAAAARITPAVVAIPSSQDDDSDVVTLPTSTLVLTVPYSTGAAAVTVRGDGSATAKWPDGKLAVSVEGTVKFSDALNAHAMFFKLAVLAKDTGNMLVSFDSDCAGTVCLGTGITVLNVSADGSGFRCDGKGNFLATWTTAGKIIPCADKVDPALIRSPFVIQAAPEIVAKYDVESRQLIVYFKCADVMHKFILGNNTPESSTQSEVQQAFAALAT